MNVCSISAFAQISDDFYYLGIWQCAWYFVAALFKEVGFNYHQRNVRSRVSVAVSNFQVSSFMTKFRSRNLSQVSEVTVSTTPLVRIICGRCQITNPGWGCRFASILQGVRSIPTAPFWKANVLGEVQESVLFEMKDKPLRVKLVIVSLLEHNLNQQISMLNFRSLNSTCKVNIDESFVSSTFKPDIALPNVR